MKQIRRQLPTALVGNIKQWVAYICPSIYFNSIFLTDWPLNLCLLCVGHDHSLSGIESQGQRSMSIEDSFSSYH